MLDPTELRFDLFEPTPELLLELVSLDEPELEVPEEPDVVESVLSVLVDPEVSLVALPEVDVPVVDVSGVVA